MIAVVVAGMSDVYLVMCRTGGKGSGGGGVSCLLIPATSVGLSFGANEDKLGSVSQSVSQHSYIYSKSTITYSMFHAEEIIISK